MCLIAIAVRDDLVQPQVGGSEKISLEIRKTFLALNKELGKIIIVLLNRLPLGSQ